MLLINAYNQRLEVQQFSYNSVLIIENNNVPTFWH